MPLLKHAKKKQRQDIKRTIERKKLKTLYKSLIKKAKEEPTPESISIAFKAIDKAAKKNLMHDNKAAHLKSALSKVSSGGSKIQAPAPRKHLTKAAKAKANKSIKSELVDVKPATKVKKSTKKSSPKKK